MRWRAALVSGVWLLALPVAWAQQMALEPSAAVKCLTPVVAQRGEPEYPFAAFKQAKAGRVKVALRFTSPTGRPAVEVLESEGDDEFVGAVKDHVREFRVPCHGGGDTPVMLQFEYVFRPDDRTVHWSAPIDSADVDRSRLSRCVAHAAGVKKPDYPALAGKHGIQGRVLARLVFSAPDQPPVATVFAEPGAGFLEMEIAEWVKGLRMPCHTGGPVSAVWTYTFVFAGDAYGFSPGLELRSLMSRVKGIDKAHLKLDLTTMGCPFDIRFEYRQPHLANRVGEVGSTNPARRPLLEWLESAQLNLSRKDHARVFGDTAQVHVPCLKINLNPT